MNKIDTTDPRRAQTLRFALPTGSDPAAVRARVTALEHLLERSLVIPGINLPVGLDAVLGLVPVLGDLLAAMVGAWIVWEAHNLGLPKWKLARMGANVLFDTALGALPVVGDAADVLFRLNAKNLRILVRHLDRHHPHTRVVSG